MAERKHRELGRSYTFKDYVPKSFMQIILSGIGGLSLLLMSACGSPTAIQSPEQSPPPTEQPQKPQQPEKIAPVEKYLSDKKLEVYTPTLKYLEKDNLFDENEKAFVDLIAQYKEVDKIYQGFISEMVKLPDLSVIDNNDTVAIERVLNLAVNPSYKEAFNILLKEGVREKRKYCSLLEALLWIAYDENIEKDNSLDSLSIEKLINHGWKDTSTSKNYKSLRWSDFDEVVDRLSSPRLVTTYCIDNFAFDPDKWNTYTSTGKLQPITPPKEVFINKDGACMDQSMFVYYCLGRNGFTFDRFDTNKDYAAGVLAATPRGGGGHFTCLYIEDSKFYVIDVGTAKTRGIKGPFTTIGDAATATFPGWGIVTLYYWDFNMNRPGFVSGPPPSSTPVGPPPRKN